MRGAIIGDISGSRFEFTPTKSKDFELFTPSCRFTDDTVLTIAIAKALLDSAGDYTELQKATIESMQELGRRYPDAGYGARFKDWLNSPDPKPYNSFGNGSAMRVSACGYVATNAAEAVCLAHQTSAVTHDHPAAIEAAEAVSLAIFLARSGLSKAEIKRELHRYYPLTKSLAEIRQDYGFEVHAAYSVPEAITAWLESTSLEDAIRNAISLGGDADTQAAIAGSIAEAEYGLDSELWTAATKYLDSYLLSIVEQFTEHFC